MSGKEEKMYILEIHVCYDDWREVGRGTLKEMQRLSDEYGGKTRILEA